MKKFMLNDAETACLGVELVKIGGKKSVSLRKFYKKKDSDEWLPSRQGVLVPLDVSDKLRKAIRVVSEDTQNYKDLGDYKKEKKDEPKKKKSKDEDDDY